MNAGLLRALFLPAPPLACEVSRVVVMGTFPSWVEGALGSAELAASDCGIDDRDAKSCLPRRPHQSTNA
jgi:hypothetical protein